MLSPPDALPTIQIAVKEGLVRPRHRSHKDMEMNRITSENLSVSEQDSYEVSYEVSPAVPQFVYIMSCCFMAIICCFGVLANLSIFVLFYNSPLVSLMQTSHTSNRTEVHQSFHIRDIYCIYGYQIPNT